MRSPDIRSYSGTRLVITARAPPVERTVISADMTGLARLSARTTSDAVFMVSSSLRIAPREPSRSEAAIRLRRSIDLVSSHIGRQRMELKNLILRDGHEVRRKDQEIRKLSGFDRTLHLFLKRRKRIVVGGDA